MGDSADRVIKNRPHRLNLVYTNHPLYFVTFATRDRKKLVSLERAQLALEAYGQGAANKFNVALGRYVIMPDHVHLFVRGDQNLILSSWIGGLKRTMSVALQSPKIWQPGFFDHLLRTNESYSAKWSYVRDNPVRAGLVRTADECHTKAKLCSSTAREFNGRCPHRAADTAAST